MKDAIDFAITLAMVLSFTFGAKKTHDYVKEMAVKRISKGLSPTEPFAQKLTGEKLPF